jgi:hypothetical protein
VTNEQRNAEVLLELADLHAEGGLGDMQLVGCARHVPDLDYR